MTTAAPQRPTTDPSPRTVRPGDPAARRERQERALFERLAEGDAHAREALVRRFLPLARSLALRYQRSHEPLDDLLQVASLGLLKAIDRFDCEREIAFSSYAVPTILGEIKRHFRDRTWAVRVPRGLQELTLNAERAVGELAEQLRRQPTVAEITAQLGADEERVLEALQARHAHRAVSFDVPRFDDERGGTLADALGVIEDGYARAEDRATAQRAMATLTARERDVLKMRFEQDMTQAEIGAVIGVTQMQISRIIRKTIARLHATTTPAARAETNPDSARSVVAA